MKLARLQKAILERDAQLDSIARAVPGHPSNLATRSRSKPIRCLSTRRWQVGVQERYPRICGQPNAIHQCIGLNYVLDASRCCGCCTDRSGDRKAIEWKIQQREYSLAPLGELQSDTPAHDSNRNTIALMGALDEVQQDPPVYGFICRQIAACSRPCGDSAFIHRCPSRLI